MSKLIRDPQLDQLVHELNQRNEAAANTATWPPAHLSSGNPLEAMLAEVVRLGGSDAPGARGGR